MKISIVVPAYNEEKLLGRTLRSIKAAAEAFRAIGWEWELIVCDNNSNDTTAEIARDEGAHVVFEPINQIARARNAGACAAQGDWIIFVDADSHPSAELFADTAHAIMSRKFVGGGATVRMDVSSLELRLSEILWNTLSRAKRWCAGSFIFVETAAFRVTGGFSHELFVSEEIDFSERLRSYAKQHGKGMVILHRHPLLTSARKIGLYGHRAHLRFILRVIFHGKSVLKTRDECGIWYDGRR